MAHNYYCLRISVLLLFLFSVWTLSAQWDSIPAPGNEDVYKVLPIGQSWIALSESGCYYSGNDGLTWDKRLTIDAYYNTDFCRDNQELYLISAGKGLYKSSDEGQHWSLMSAQMPPNPTGYPDKIAATEHYILFNTYSDVFRYDKSNPMAPTSVLGVAPFYPNRINMQVDGNNVWIVVKDSLLHSSDEGDTWTVVHEGLTAQSFALHSDTMMVATTTGVQRSTDGGVSWQMVYPYSSDYNHVYWDAGVWYASYTTPLDYETKYSTDGGATWQVHALSPYLYSTSSIARKGNTILAVSGYGVLRSPDGGIQWMRNNGGLGFDGGNWFESSKLYSVGNYLGFELDLSEDQGQSWFLPVTLLGVYSYAIRPPMFLYDNSYFICDNNTGNVYRSDQDAQHWQVIGQIPQAGWHQFFSTNTRLYRVDFDANAPVGLIYESTDKGISWTSTGGTAGSGATLVTSNEFIFEWRGELGLFRSSNGGVSWQSVGAGLNDFGQFSDTPILYAAGNALFAYNDSRIAVSTNNGLTFDLINQTLLNSFGYPMGATSLTYDGSTLIVTTYDGRVMLCQGLNDQWVNITANLPGLNFYDSWVIIHQGDIYLNFEYSQTPLWRRSMASLNIAQLSGQVYRDNNNNGQQDPGESPYPGAIVQAGLGSFATAGTNGQYSFFADLSNDTLRVNLPSPWVQPNPPFYLVNTSAADKNFGLFFPPDITDLGIDLTNETVFRPGFQDRIHLTYTNPGTANADATVRLVLQPPLELVFAIPESDGSNGDTLFWNLENLHAFATDQIIVGVKVSADAPLGSNAVAWAGISPTLANDVNGANNQAFLTERIVGSYDPNDKRCDFPTISPEQIHAGAALTYTIRFQNTGTYPAEFVRVTDTLDFERLDVSTLEILATSHPCQTTVRGNGLVEFFFDQIDLPPAENNEPASHGFVKYRIRPKADLALGQQIRNTAYIYFDYNSPIVTNTTATPVALPLGTQHIGPNGNILPLSITPNPTAGMVYLQTGETEVGSLRVFNTLGELVLEQTAVGSEGKLDLSGLVPGHYTVEWRSAAGLRKVGSLVRM